MSPTAGSSLTMFLPLVMISAAFWNYVYERIVMCQSCGLCIYYCAIQRSTHKAVKSNSASSHVQRT
jgi:ferredoxin